MPFGARADTEGQGLASAVAAFELVIGRFGDQLDKWASERRAQSQLDAMWQQVHQVPMAALETGTAATLGLADQRWGPLDGYAWHVVRVTVAFGSGATSVTLYKSQVADANALQILLPPSSGTVATWEPKALVLQPWDRVIAVVAGGGATINGDAIEVDIRVLPEYLL